MKWYLGNALRDDGVMGNSPLIEAYVCISQVVVHGNFIVYKLLSLLTWLY